MKLPARLTPARSPVVPPMPRSSLLQLGILYSSTAKTPGCTSSLGACAELQPAVVCDPVVEFCDMRARQPLLPCRRTPNAVDPAGLQSQHASVVVFVEFANALLPIRLLSLLRVLALAIPCSTPSSSFAWPVVMCARA